RDERHPTVADRADGQRSRRRPVRRVDLDLLPVVQERIEPGAAEDPDANPIECRLAQAERSLADEEGDSVFDDDVFEARSLVPELPEPGELAAFELSFDPPSPFWPPSPAPALAREARESVA